MSARARGGDFLALKNAEVRRRSAHAPARHPDAAAHRVRLAELPPAPSLTAAVLAPSTHVAVLAEYKRRSPSAGPLADDEDPVTVTTAYLEAGAAGLSVLTDADHFGGNLADLAAVTAAHPLVPTLRKDFIVDADGIVDARLAGAAAALLIAGMLDDHELATLLATGAAVGCECLVEVHDLVELERAGAAGATLIGINNRDLRSLTTDLAVTERLAPHAPPGAAIVSESGIRSASDVRRVRDAGAHAVLVGETLLRTPPAGRAARLRDLALVPR